MAQKAQRPAAAWWFTLRREHGLPAEEATRFLLDPLTGPERMDVWDKLAGRAALDGQQLQPQTFRTARELCIAKIRDIQNFPSMRKNPDGTYTDQAEPYPVLGTRDDKAAYIDQLDEFDIVEIGHEIRDQSSLSPQLKNSSPPKPTSVSPGASAAMTSTDARSAQPAPS